MPRITSREGRAARLVDVAAVAGVSHQTVSRVLNQHPSVSRLTRDRVLAAIDALGYRRNEPARLLASHRSRRLGLVTVDAERAGPVPSAPWLRSAARREGWEVVEVLVDPTGRSGGTCADDLERLLAEGAETVVVDIAAEPLLGVLRRRLEDRVPVVAVPTGASCLATRHGVEHLLDLGHREVALVAGPTGWRLARDQVHAWREAHRLRGAEPGPLWHAGWTHRAGDETAPAVAASGVSAVVVADDRVAQGLLLGLHRHGARVPEDVSVVGTGDRLGSEFLIPPLTSTPPVRAALEAERAVAEAVAAVAAMRAGRQDRAAGRGRQDTTRSSDDSKVNEVSEDSDRRDDGGGRSGWVRVRSSSAPPRTGPLADRRVAVLGTSAVSA